MEGCPPCKPKRSVIGRISADNSPKLQRVATWFPYRKGRLTKGDSNSAVLAAIAQHFANLTGLYLEKPRMAQPSQEYMRRFWPTHIGPIFQVEWDAKCEQLRAEGKEVPKIGVEDRNAVVRRFWAQESKEVQDAIIKDVEEEYEAKMLVYREQMSNIPKIGKLYTW